MPDYPRRRYIYHLYPKMKGDLGSYEKYCFRTLSEQYHDEPLLLQCLLSGSNDAKLQPGAHRHLSSSPVYHVSPVGTILASNPQRVAYMYIGNYLEVVPLITTKLYVFSFGILMTVMLLNVDGPCHLQQMGTMLLTEYEPTSQLLVLASNRRKY